MKPAHTFIALTALAVSLTGVLAYVANRKPAPGNLHQASGVVSSPAPRIQFVREKKSGEPSPAAEKFTWQRVESADYKTYIANLRAIDCPEETIREIIVTDVNKLFAPREAPFRSELTAPFPWEGSGNISYSSLTEAERRAEFEKKKQLREVQLEKRTLLKELLNIETPLETLRGVHTRDYELFEAAFNSVRADKREMVRQIQENYWQVSDATSDQFNGLRSPEYLEEYKRNNAERRRQLAQVLTPQELEEYELRASSTATRLAAQLSQFNPFPEEFRQIARIRKAIDEPFGGALTVRSTEQSPEANAQRQKESNEQIRGILGEERFAEYERSQDYNFTRLATLGERYNIPKESVLKAYEIQKTANERFQKVNADGALSNDQRQEAYRAVQSEIAAGLTEALGEKAFKAFSRRNGYGLRFDPGN